MGRTKRQRKRRTKSTYEISLDKDTKIINLKIWLTQLSWKDESRLKLRNFPSSGRGVSSSINIRGGEKLISIPYEAMITYNSFERTEISCILRKYPNTFKTDEAFAMFLCLEIHKREKSEWKIYLDTLPEPPVMPWKCSDDEMKLIPEEMLNKINKYRIFLIHSIKKVFTLLKNGDFRCDCCKKHLYGVITKEGLYSSYVLFMTRCIYVHYKHLKCFSKENIDALLGDEPNMVLCPLLDMFNHETDAEAELLFKNESNGYFLNIITGRCFPRRSQLFFSYGKHDNLSLFSYYGFYLPFNNLDFIEFTTEDVDFLFNSKEKWDFVLERRLNENLIWHIYEPSFNLIIISYISCTEDTDWRSKIFSTEYFDKEQVLSVLRLLMINKMIVYKKKLRLMEGLAEKSDSLLTVIEFCKHRLNVMDFMLNEIKL